MAYKPPKTKKIFDITINVKGEKINLGKLVKVTNSRCSITKRNIQTFTCLHTGKNFTNYLKASNYIADYLVKSGKVILNN